MLAPGNYVQWKSRIKRYIDTKPNHELIHYCLKNPSYKLDWQDVEVPVSEGSPITTTERIRETYKNVWQDIRDQLNAEAEAEAVQIILTGIDNDIYSIVDACPKAQADWRDDTNDDELEDQQLEAHYMYMAQLQEVSPDAAESRSIFDDEPLQKVSNDDHYNLFAMEKEIDQDDDDNDLAKERELLASLIEKLKCEIDESKNRNKFLETSNKVLIDKLKGEIEDFKNKNKSLESSNNKLSETNNLLYADYKTSEAELARRNSTEYASQMELECAKVRGDLLSYKM
nr:hypothetical protein [Tanacetum cinerariifolium]